MADDKLSYPEQEPTHQLTPFERTVLQRFDQADERFNKIDERFNEVDDRFNKIDERFNKVDERFNKVDDRLDKLEAKALDTKPIWEQALAEILSVKLEVVEVKDRLHRVEGALGILVEDVVKVRADLHGFHRRLMILEKH